MATIKEVSELAGVSLATVSRVINKSDQVKDATKLKVEQAMQSLGYRPNFIARSLASNKSNTVGYVVPELHGPFFGDMLSGTEKRLKKANKHLFISAGHSNEVDEINAIESLLDRRCDALILHLEAVSNQYLVDLAGQGLQFVVVNRYIEEIADRCVCLNNRLGGYLATQTLIRHGHKDIAYISGDLWKNDAAARFNGHRQALEDAGIAFNRLLVFEGNFQAESGYNGMLGFLEGAVIPSGVACGNDEMAYGAMQAIREQGYDIPKHISIVGFDNIEFSQFSYPRLSTINYPMDKIGEAAASWILHHIYNEADKSKERIFDPEYVARDSIAVVKD